MGLIYAPYDARALQENALISLLPVNMVNIWEEVTANNNILQYVQQSVGEERK